MAARIFQVTVRKEASFTIVANSQEELDAALKASEIDDWSIDQWEWDIHDPLQRIKTVDDLDRVKDNPKAPQMGVVKGEVFDLSDVKAEIPDIEEQITAEIKALKYRITTADRQVKLFEP